MAKVTIKTSSCERCNGTGSESYMATADDGPYTRTCTLCKGTGNITYPDRDSSEINRLIEERQAYRREQNQPARCPNDNTPLTYQDDRGDDGNLLLAWLECENCDYREAVEDSL